MTGTYVGPSGAIVLAGGLATNCTIQQLYLSRTSVGGIGSAAIARSVTGHPALRLLDLSFNVGDVDEGWLKRDRLEEFEKRQTERAERERRRKQRRLMASSKKKDGDKAGAGKDASRSKSPAAGKRRGRSEEPTRSRKTTTRSQEPARTARSKGASSARGVSTDKASERSGKPEAAGEETKRAERAKPKEPLHQFFLPKVRRFRYKNPVVLPPGFREERERFTTSMSELILGVPSRWITFKDDDQVLSSEEQAKLKREYKRKQRQEAALTKAGRISPKKDAPPAEETKAATPPPPVELEPPVSATGSVTPLTSTREPGAPKMSRKQMLESARAAAKLRDEIASDPTRDPKLYEFTPYLPPNHPPDIIDMTLPVVRLKRKPLPSKLQSLTIAGNGITDDEMCRIVDSLAAAKNLTELKYVCVCVCVYSVFALLVSSLLMCARVCVVMLYCGDVCAA